MRLSEEIALGRALMYPVAGIEDDGKGGGCAIGMAHKAAGRATVSFGIAGKAHPWLLTTCFDSAMPCNCGLDGTLVTGGGMMKIPRMYINNALSIIVHLFNHHVMTAKDWTLDQFIDWIRSVEPPQEEEEIKVALNEVQVVDMARVI